MCVNKTTQQNYNIYYIRYHSFINVALFFLSFLIYVFALFHEVVFFYFVKFKVRGGGVYTPTPSGSANEYGLVA